MENHALRTFMGLSGYSFLIFSAVILDAPIIALLAIPIFAASAIVLLIFYDKILSYNYKPAMLGLIILIGILAYSSIEFNQHLVLVSRNEFTGMTQTSWLKILVIAALNILSSYMVYLGLRNDKMKFKWHPRLGWWLPTLFILPIVLSLLYLSYKTGNWMGG